MSFSPQLQPTDPGNVPPVYPSFSPSDANESAPAPAATAARHIPHDLLNRRSCVTCRRRKVRCDKRSPCSNCARAGVECIFPRPGRAPRKPKRPPDAELLSRLQQLESVVERISENRAAVPNANVQVTPSPPQQRSDRSSDEPSGRSQNVESEHCPLAAGMGHDTSLEHEFGRLVIDDNRSRYVSNRFWASLGDEIKELQDILDPSSSDEEDHSSPGSSSSYSTIHDGMLFGFYSLAHSLRSFHPPSSKIPVLWNVYAENVKPVLPIVYGPVAQQLFTTAARTPDSLDKNTEALVLAMYFAAIISMSKEQCLSLLGEPRDSAVGRYRFAVEQALSRANLLNTQSLTLMQAAVTFLNAARREDDTKFVWSMCAVIIRLAQGLGLHRDGSNFGLKVFETEMRRRLWWHIVLLDIRSSEDHGTDVQINDRMFDTRLPLNINESDIAPNMQAPPKERVGFTDITFFLVRCDICYALRRVAYTCPNTSGAVLGPTPENCGKVVQAVNRRIEERYLKHCNLSDPIQWVCATIARLVMTKMWLVIHHPMTRTDLGDQISHDSRESLFITSIEVTEFARLVTTDPRTAKWSWLFESHMQWHAIATVLAELCVRPLSPLTDRAWMAVTTVYEDWLRTAKQRKGMLWRPLAQLMKRAGALREKQRQELQARITGQDTHPVPATPSQAGMGSPFSAHFPELAKLAAAVPPMDWDPSQPLDFNLIPGSINDVAPPPFPVNNWPVNPDPRSSTPQVLMNMSASMGMPREPLPLGIAQDPGLQLTREEWDQILRDFQLEVQGAQGNPIGDITGWVA